MAALAIAGAIAAGLYGGSSWAAGFLIGAVFSAVNFWFWHRLVARVGEPAKSGGSPRSAPAVLFGVRYLIFVAGAYVILQYFGASLLAALTGIFVAVAAVLIEIFLELIYGT
jgi:ATP synthase I chain